MSLPVSLQPRARGMASGRPARLTCGIAQGTAGLAQEVLERAKRRKVGWPEPVKYYSCVPASRCQENEFKHICRYHGRQAAEMLQTLEPKKNETSPMSSATETLKQHARKASKDLYIEVSPGTYSVTATAEDMVKQTHVVDINAGQCIDLTFNM
ncbi:A-kinase-interacting protein 1 isoform X3 [Carettochelys insculpta]|uniref:A-kinase-interacting protein 1 isoform X3 n=1 Tax=Carettochelys insculpta TaxID=44489 RepID=UPI003EBC0DC6